MSPLKGLTVDDSDVLIFLFKFEFLFIFIHVFHLFKFSNNVRRRCRTSPFSAGWKEPGPWVGDAPMFVEALKEQLVSVWASQLINTGGDLWRWKWNRTVQRNQKGFTPRLEEILVPDSTVVIPREPWKNWSLAELLCLYRNPSSTVLCLINLW